MSKDLLPTSAGQRRIWAGLHGCAKAWAIAQAAEAARSALLVITTDTLSADRLENELRFFLGPGSSIPVVGFPDWETLPYDRFSPYQDIISDRLASLARLPELGKGVLVVSARTLLHRLVAPVFVHGHSLVLGLGDRVDRDAFRGRLELAGYRCVSQVVEHGEYSLRGSLIDVFPMGSTVPYRIDLFDDTVDGLRVFDPETQRSENNVTSIRVLPAREYPLDGPALARFRTNWIKRFDTRGIHGELYKEVTAGRSPAGIEYYLPLFFDETSTLFDYLPSGAAVIVDRQVESVADVFWHDVNERYEQRRHDIERPVLPPSELFLQGHQLFGLIKNLPAVVIDDDVDVTTSATKQFSTMMAHHVAVDARAADPLAALRVFLSDFQAAHGGRTVFVAESAGRRETLQELFRSHGLKVEACADWKAFLVGSQPLALTVAPLDRGTVLVQAGIAVLSEAELFGERVAQRRLRRRANRDPEAVIRDLTELNLGAPVVHHDHGIGRYRGLMALDADGLVAEYVVLEYSGADKLYVPVASLHLLSRYSGFDPEHAPWHKLGSGQWEKARRRAAQKVIDVAAELLDLYARRAARQGHACMFDREAYQGFVAGFPFEETPDQARAIDVVLADMQATQPMDRLVCGDVGFGKTEVAMRAAFVAAHAGQQVAFLVPTTLLAQQHSQNLLDRFADWPIKIEQLSRFRAKKEMDVVLKGIADGTVDIVVGTHKLLQDDVKFKRLGLVIIDEEHRFGVRQKERLKALRSDVDVLTLTATPIPRTLSMALQGTRELSVIATPPARRLAVKTFVREWDNTLLREGLMREISRGGQVYFLHNDIETIEKISATIQGLVPEARVQIAHGQMRERELERVMQDFYHRRFNVLVCTTIIESGIDIPSANTIVINRADRFGLAQLYQLRGRVGRSHHRAYAYLVIPHRKALSPDAMKRMDAIESLEELGVGFTLAVHDLEIRGAGEILGAGQSGHIQEVGFSLYAEMLERAIADLKQGVRPDLERPPTASAEVDLHVPALFPEDYLPDVHNRLILYKRIASTHTSDELLELREEIIDRFGALPEAAQNLICLADIRIKAADLGIRKLDIGVDGGRIYFQAQPRIDTAALIKQVQSEPGSYRVDRDQSLRILRSLPVAKDRVSTLETLFAQLTLKPLRQADKLTVH